MAVNAIPQRQSRTWQGKLIDGAKRQGRLCDLYWFVNAYVPGHNYPDGKARVQPAMFPRGYTPVVAIVPDEVESRHYADILRELFASVNRRRGFDFVVEITDIHELRAGNWNWYEWGQSWDCVCEVCGSVFQDTCPQVNLCEGCRETKC